MNTPEQSDRKLSHIHIEARRWFQRSYGNTYHRVRITLDFDNGTTERIDSGMRYGYDQQWDTTALEQVEGSFGVHVPRYDNGARRYGYLTTWANANGVPITTTVVDVPRKRDL